MSQLVPPISKQIHPRTVWRYLVCHLLRQTDFPGEVYPNREEPWLSNELPAIGVYTTEETLVETDASPAPDDRMVTLVVEILAQKNAHLDDALDAFCLMVEQALTFEILARESGEWPLVAFAYSDTSIGYAEEGEKVCGAATLTFDLTYRVPGILPDLPDFITGYAGWDLVDRGGPDGRLEAEDIIHLPGPWAEPLDAAGKTGTEQGADQ